MTIEAPLPKKPAPVIVIVADWLLFAVFAFIVVTVGVTVKTLPAAVTLVPFVLVTFKYHAPA